MNVNELLEKGIRNLQQGFRRHRTLVFGVVAMLVLIVIGNVLKSSVNDAILARQKTISDLKNNITMEDNKAQKVVEIVAEPNHGLSTKRWQNDNALMLKWIEPAFTWNNLEEYQTHREFYVERLGEDDPFVRDFLVERQATYAFQDGYNVKVDDGADINMHITSRDGFKTFVTGINEDTGVYSYLALVRVTSSDMAGNEGTSEMTIALTYDVTSEGDIQNFKYTLAYI